jgi:hypothetical protein
VAAEASPEAATPAEDSFTRISDNKTTFVSLRFAPYPGKWSTKVVLLSIINKAFSSKSTIFA